jgi:hypothetical protein
MSSTAVTSPATGPAAAGNRVPASPRVGMFPPIGLLERGPETARAFLAQVAGAGIDHICCGDHVSLRYCPYGTADDVAEFLAPYAEAGCAEFNLIPQSPDPDRAIAGAAAVKKLLARA